MDNATAKTCVRCGESKPLTEFHKRAIAYDGLNAACKVCICAERRQYTAEHPERLQAYRKQVQANPEMLERKLERTRQWRADNPERRRAYLRAYEEANREEVAARKHEWYLANRDHVLAWPERNPEKAAERALRYKENHRDVLVERAERRRAQKLGTACGDVDLEALWTGHCGLCGGDLDATGRWPDPASKSVDHIVPLVRGGSHTQDNLQWTHLRCNVSKGARMPA